MLFLIVAITRYFHTLDKSDDDDDADSVPSNQHMKMIQLRMLHQGQDPLAKGWEICKCKYMILLHMNLNIREKFTCLGSAIQLKSLNYQRRFCEL